MIAQWLHIFGVKTVIASGHSDKHGEVMKQVASSAYVYLDANRGDVVEQVMTLRDGAYV